MEGVILFADDFVFNNADFENKLFHKIKSNGIPVLPIGNLTDFENTIKSISTYKAIILDWEFIEMLEEQKATKNPLDILKKNKFYCLIFIYSHTTIGEQTQKELKEIFGNKIEFLAKIKKDEEVDSECNKLLDSIKKFELNNIHLETPFLWSQAINQSAQDIFFELEEADPNWIKEIYSSAKADGTEPNTEVIGIFQNLLNESIVQNKNLTASLAASAALPDINVANKDESLAKLYHRIYYTKLVDGTPIMTGDILALSSDFCAILITPECDVAFKKSNLMEYFLVKRDSFDDYLKKENLQKGKFTSNQKEKALKYFNQSEMKFFFLPSFPFREKVLNETAVINFQTSLTQIHASEMIDAKRIYKLNSPYIHQLRQKYIAYIGRVGVPAIPASLRDFNLK